MDVNFVFLKQKGGKMNILFIIGATLITIGIILASTFYEAMGFPMVLIGVGIVCATNAGYFIYLIWKAWHKYLDLDGDNDSK